MDFAEWLNRGCGGGVSQCRYYIEKTNSNIWCQRIQGHSSIRWHQILQAHSRTHRSPVVDLFDGMESWCISVGSNLITILN